MGAQDIVADSAISVNGDMNGHDQCYGKNFDRRS